MNTFYSTIEKGESEHLKKSNKKPILITGSHRSGSTWTGRMVARAKSVAYIHEPFNLQHRPGMCRAQFNYQFPYICQENESIYMKDLEDCLRFKYHLLADLQNYKSLKENVRSILYYYRFAKYRILKKRPLIKDPIAVFSAEWLAQKFNMDVVVLVRHPAAFAGSLKKVKWTHPFEHFLQQPLLMENYLHEYKPEIEEFSKNKKSIIEQAILLWNLIHHIILIYQNNHPNWIFLKHEDLSRSPTEEFKKLYNRLDLAFSKEIEQSIESFSLPSQPQNYIHSINSKIKRWQDKFTLDNSEKYRRNSKTNIFSWKERLTCDDVKKIKKGTNTIASKFYSQKDW